MSALINVLGEVNPTLLQLVRKTKSEGVNIKVSDTITPSALNAILQTNWLQPGKFRFEIMGRAPNPEEVGILRELGCIDEFRVSVHGESLWNSALLLGALLPRVRSRVAFLADEYRRGVGFKKVYLLGSNRLLNTEKESAHELCFPKGIPLRQGWDSGQPLPANEIEMMRFVAEQSEIPAEWEIIPVRTPDVPLKGSGSRPANTGDTFNRWQEMTGLTEGNFLVVSNNPFVSYQLTNARRILPLEMNLHAIGSAANLELPFGTFLDNLAKQLYEENLLREQLDRQPV